MLTKAIETGEFDTVLVPLNVVTRQALEELVPAAKAQKVGIAVMKPLSGKTSRLITCLYKPSLSLLSPETELKAMLGQDADEMARNALRFVLSQDIAVTIPGVKSVREACVAAQAGNEFVALTKEEQERFHVELGNYCRDCGCCLPCPEGIDIAAALRFHTLSEQYGLRRWTLKLYSGLEINASKCTNCGICTPRCPYGLPVADRLHEAHKTLGR